VYVTGVAGAVCYIGGLVSSLRGQEAWMIAALASAVVLLGSMTAVLAADFWLLKRQGRRLVRDIEAWMSGTARQHGDGGRRN